LDSYFALGGELNDLAWRTYTPAVLFSKVAECVEGRWR
jgi:hypothetical protein